MIYLASSILFFLLMLMVHLSLHKLLARFGIKSFWTETIFFFGFILYIFIILPKIPDTSLPLPLTSAIFYLCLTGFHFVYYVSTLSGERSPSAEIFFLLRYKKVTRYKDIIGKFSDTELIKYRLNSLIKSHLVKKKGDRYFILPKGKKIVFAVNLYRQLLNWNSSG